MEPLRIAGFLPQANDENSVRVQRIQGGESLAATVRNQLRMASREGSSAPDRRAPATGTRPTAKPPVRRTSAPRRRWPRPARRRRSTARSRHRPGETCLPNRKRRLARSETPAPGEMRRSPARADSAGRASPRSDARRAFVRRPTRKPETWRWHARSFRAARAHAGARPRAATGDPARAREDRRSLAKPSARGRPHPARPAPRRHLSIPAPDRSPPHPRLPAESRPSG